MSEAEENVLSAPYVRAGVNVRAMILWVLGCLFVLAGLFAAIYDPAYFPVFCGHVAIGLAIEAAYCLLSEGRFGLKSGSSAITAGILSLSVPSTMPLWPMVFALLFAVLVVRLSANGSRLRLNPVLMGRLFLMLAYNAEIVAWTRRGTAADAVTTATPLDLFHAEGAVYALAKLLSGRIGGEWEGMYTLVPGSPGEIFTPVVLAMGLLLVWRRVVDCRMGLAFLGSFAATCAILRLPVAFSVFSGAVVFASVFIAGDPGSTPASKAGRFIAGIVAGVANAAIRKYTFYSEGIVFAFLLANLLTPTLDRLAFAARSYLLIRRRRAFELRPHERSSSALR